MAQEQEKKPKVTLIKHQDTEPKEEAPPTPAVPVKKKRVVVKKTKKVVAVVKTDTPEEAPPTESPQPQGPEAKTSEPTSPPSTPRQPAREEGPRDRSRPPRPRGDRRPPRPQRNRGPKPGGPPSRDQGADRTKPRLRITPKTGAPPVPPAGETPEAARARQQKERERERRRELYLEKEREQEEKILNQVKRKKKIETNPVPKEIDITEAITVAELAKKMNLKASVLIAKLMSMGMMVTINQQIDADTATLLADEFGCKVNVVSLYDETVIEREEDSEEDLRPRPPVVTVMGHVDHGKTKLLDAIRSANVAEGEYGGITQHIGAYQVELPQGKITFLDTPGHEAFTLMRARGAQVTDIVVLVVAANDGVMPQTVEALNHAKEANVPIIVAINKVDLPDANPDRVKQQLSEYGLIPEEWGGNTIYCEVSALKKQGIQELLEAILLQAEVLELKANYSCRAEGKILESKIEHGRGIVATVLVQRGTLRIGDPFVAGVYSGKVRAMFDEWGNREEEATPSTPVEVLGFDGLPEAGDPFQVTESEKHAREVASKRQELKKLEEARNVQKVTLDNLYQKIQEGEVQDLKIIIKADVHGSAEAIRTALERLSTEEIRVRIIHAAAGAVNESDVRLASASNAIIVAFNVRPTSQASTLAEKEKVEIRRYTIIYEVIDDIKAAMEGMLQPEIKEEVVGLVEVRETFKVPRIGTVAGCYVLEGKVKRNAEVNVIRDGVVIHSTRINSLKRFKEDVREVDAGYECGIGLEGFQDIKVGDQFEVIERREIAKKL
ncbi:translation initiation factor IF-2 [Spirochaeta thermophila]|uniref:Translation initiation factor IF-2 n=1 Tax=Winmispira thermophila (strain ATCC 49972 / DSM 6192 / RI 19.B1) TaxID=665571 RepID=E0RSS6_WINT6|nr:translation initiation factor IF-2 [Spirochaeta thermophila]ADN02063.1 translation initiation factor IF-2 [Spirochaeta thermophila DSM 6192]